MSNKWIASSKIHISLIFYVQHMYSKCIYIFTVSSELVSIFICVPLLNCAVLVSFLSPGFGYGGWKSHSLWWSLFVCTAAHFLIKFSLRLSVRSLSSLVHQPTHTFSSSQVHSHIDIPVLLRPLQFHQQATTPKIILVTSSEEKSHSGNIALQTIANCVFH